MWSKITLAAANLRGEATATSSTKLDGTSPLFCFSCQERITIQRKRINKRGTVPEWLIFLTKKKKRRENVCIQSVQVTKDLFGNLTQVPLPCLRSTMIAIVALYECILFVPTFPLVLTNHKGIK